MSNNNFTSSEKMNNMSAYRNMLPLLSFRNGELRRSRSEGSLILLEVELTDQEMSSQRGKRESKLSRKSLSEESARCRAPVIAQIRSTYIGQLQKRRTRTLDGEPPIKEYDADTEEDVLDVQSDSEISIEKQQVQFQPIKRRTMSDSSLSASLNVYGHKGLFENLKTQNTRVFEKPVNERIDVQKVKEKFEYVGNEIINPLSNPNTAMMDGSLRRLDEKAKVTNNQLKDSGFIPPVPNKPPPILKQKPCTGMQTSTIDSSLLQKGSSVLHEEEEPTDLPMDNKHLLKKQNNVGELASVWYNAKSDSQEEDSSNVELDLPIASKQLLIKQKSDVGQITSTWYNAGKSAVQKEYSTLQGGDSSNDELVQHNLHPKPIVKPKPKPRKTISNTLQEESSQGVNTLISSVSNLLIQPMQPKPLTKPKPNPREKVGNTSQEESSEDIHTSPMPKQSPRTPKNNIEEKPTNSTCAFQKDSSSEDHATVMFNKPRPPLKKQNSHIEDVNGPEVDFHKKEKEPGENGWVSSKPPEPLIKSNISGENTGTHFTSPPLEETCPLPKVCSSTISGVKNLYATDEEIERTNFDKQQVFNEKDPLHVDIYVNSGSILSMLTTSRKMKFDSLVEDSDSDNSWGSDFSDYDSEVDNFDPELDKVSASNVELGSKDKSTADDVSISESVGQVGTKQRKLFNIVNEILTTEEAYVRRLHLLHEVFFVRLYNECSSKGIVPVEDIKTIFSNLASIYKLHSELLERLEERIKKWKEDTRIGDIFKQYGPFFKMYTVFIENFDNASATLQIWMKRSPKFENIVHEIQQSKECEHLTLQHHMLEPIQRIPRYKLLLKDYLSKLPEDSPDLKDTKDALKVISSAAAHANESMKKMEKFQKLLEIQEKIGEHQDLVTASREFVREGDIIKVASRDGQAMRRTLFLFNDLLLCCARYPGANKYKVKVCMDVDGMELIEGDKVTADTDMEFTFRISSRQKVLDFAASSQEELESWKNDIQQVIDDLHSKKHSFQRGSQFISSLSDNELGKKAPLWVKDAAVTMCMTCAAAFSQFKRRHHCRACGKVVCSNCSRFKAHLAYTKHQHQQRVCEACRNKLVPRTDTQGTSSHVNKTVGTLKRVDSRKVLLEGLLSVRRGHHKSWDKFWFKLCEDFVLYGHKAKQDVEAVFTLPLPGYNVDKPHMGDDLDRQKNVFKLHHKNTQIHFFQTADDITLKKWMKYVELATKAELPELGPLDDEKQQNLSQWY